MNMVAHNRLWEDSGCSKWLSSAAAASEEARRTLRSVEPLSEVRTKLADIFSILIMNGPACSGPARLWTLPRVRWVRGFEIRITERNSRSRLA